MYSTYLYQYIEDRNKEISILLIYVSCIYIYLPHQMQRTSTKSWPMRDHRFLRPLGAPRLWLVYYYKCSIVVPELKAAPS